MAAMANKTASSEEGEREEDDQTGAPTDGLVVSRRILEPSEKGTPEFVPGLWACSD